MSRMTSLILGLRSQAGGPRWLGSAMAVLIAITLGWLVWHAWPVFRASRLPARPAEASRTDEQRRTDFAAALKKHQERVDGRSLFFVPPRPRPPRPEFVEDTTPREPPKPTRYGGPSITAMVNGQVWFNDGQRVKVGESGRNLRVVSASAPWSARIEWEGVEFDVDFFQRDSSVIRPVRQGASDVSPLTPSPGPASTPGARPAAAPPTPAAPSSGNPSAAPPPAGADPPAEPEPAPEPADEPAQPSPAPASPEPQPQPSAPEHP